MHLAAMSSMNFDLQQKREALHARLRDLGRVMVAYSGGTDSAYLAWEAHQVLGDDMLAVLADSPSLARSQMQDAIAFASEQGIPFTVVQTSELDHEDYARNAPDRCFFCKDELFTVMEEKARQLNFDYLAFGMNLDDRGDFRPGQKAAQQHRVVAPLVDAGLTKNDVRDLARAAGLRIWDKPASACLSSRIEYGRAVTREALLQVERGEDALHALGFLQCRVRHHGDLVRIEIARDDLDRAFSPEMADSFATIFKSLGFKYVALDCEGYRSGSMNAVLPLAAITRAEP
jgi:pyridinium-3,5-biscarboxylic acid mononucleotide sulfurtransferase